MDKGKIQWCYRPNRNNENIIQENDKIKNENNNNNNKTKGIQLPYISIDRKLGIDHLSTLSQNS